MNMVTAIPFYEQEARKRNKWKRNKQNVETVELWFG